LIFYKNLNNLTRTVVLDLEAIGLHLCPLRMKKIALLAGIRRGENNMGKALKRSLFCVLILAFVLTAFVACNEAKKVEIVQTCAEAVDLIQSLGDLENGAEVITKVKALPDLTNIETAFGENAFMGRTLTSFEVIECYSGDLSPDEVIVIEENYYYKMEDGVKKIITYNSYLPTEVGGEYIFFLVSNKNDSVPSDYYTIGIEMGKYACVAPKARSAASQIVTTTLYDDIREEVMSKYND